MMRSSGISGSQASNWPSIRNTRSGRSTHPLSPISRTSRRRRLRNGLKAAGVQRVEFNPSIATMSPPGNVTKYDAIVRHIRELGLQLAINPEYEIGEVDASPISYSGLMAN